MKRELAFEFSRVTEAAALAGFKWVGRGDKNLADAAAVEAMRIAFDKINIDGEIVIGEGEIDEAPMLYIGEKVGCGGEAVDIAVDPIEGTRMTAMGQSNALAVLAVGEKGAFLRAPDMYMEKLIVGTHAKHALDLSLSLEENLNAIARALGKSLENLTLATLAKPRHESMIKKVQGLGVRVFAIPDGDVALSVLACMSDNQIDLVYCVGGAPEGVISAAVVRALDGNMQARLLPHQMVKGATAENIAKGENEIARCEVAGISVNSVLNLDDLVKNDNILFSATGITLGDLVEGVRHDGNLATTETLLIRGRSRTIRRIKSTHCLNRKDPKLQDLIL